MPGIKIQHGCGVALCLQYILPKIVNEASSWDMFNRFLHRSDTMQIQYNSIQGLHKLSGYFDLPVPWQMLQTSHLAACHWYKKRSHWPQRWSCWNSSWAGRVQHLSSSKVDWKSGLTYVSSQNFILPHLLASNMHCLRLLLKWWHQGVRRMLNPLNVAVTPGLVQVRWCVMKAMNLSQQLLLQRSACETLYHLNPSSSLGRQPRSSLRMIEAGLVQDLEDHSTVPTVAAGSSRAKWGSCTHIEFLHGTPLFGTEVYANIFRCCSVA